MESFSSKVCEEIKTEIKDLSFILDVTNGLLTIGNLTLLIGFICSIGLEGNKLEEYKTIIASALLIGIIIKIYLGNQYDKVCELESDLWRGDFNRELTIDIIGEAKLDEIIENVKKECQNL